MKRVKCSSGLATESRSTNQTVIWYDFKALERAERLEWYTIGCAHTTHTHLMFKHFKLKMPEAVCSLYLISIITTFFCRELITLKLSKVCAVIELFWNFNSFILKSFMNVQYLIIYNVTSLDYRHVH